MKKKILEIIMFRIMGVIIIMARKGKMISHEINSQHLDEAVTVKIFLPQKFTSPHQYNLCIMLDGDDYYQLGRAATLSDRLHESGEIRNTILAGVHYKDRYDRWEKYHPAGEKYEAFDQFLTFEVDPLLEKFLPSYHIDVTKVLMGDSLAGTASLLTALKHPNTFHKVVMQSPYVDHYVFEAVSQSDNLSEIEIYHTIGKNELAVKTIRSEAEDFLTPNRELNEVLQQKVNNYTYFELEGEHTWKQWQKDLPNVFKTVFKS